MVINEDIKVGDIISIEDSKDIWVVTDSCLQGNSNIKAIVKLHDMYCRTTIPTVIATEKIIKVMGSIYKYESIIGNEREVC